MVSGGLKCWGWNYYGQLGDGTGENKSSLTEIIFSGSGVTAIAAGVIHTCALVSGGLKCWGDNSYGQLGDGTTTQRNSPTQIIAAGSGLADTNSSYKATFNSNGGSAVSDGSFESAGSVSVPTAPTRSGYTFLGWSATDGGTVVDFPYSPGVTTDITMYAKWSADSHSVTFNSKGGTAVSAGSFRTDGSLVAPSAPTRSGYTFQGWSATDGGTALEFPYSPGVITDITLYAKWVVASHSVTFNSKGGTSVSDGSFNEGGSIGSSSSLYGSADPANYVATSAIELGARLSTSQAGWVKTVKYFKYAGDDSSHSAHIWSADGTLLASQDFVDQSSSGWQSVVLDAPVFIEANQTFTISVYSNSFKWGDRYRTEYDLGPLTFIGSKFAFGGAPSYPSGAYGSVFSVDLVFETSSATAPTRSGYSFQGWSATDGGSALAFPYSPSATSDITLYAVWSGDSHAVTFSSKGGTSVSAGSFRTGGSIVAPSAPTRSGYTFLGWSATDGGTVVEFPYSPGVETDITLYAVWSADSHAVTFNSKSGSAVSAGSFATAGSLTAPTAPTRTGYTFLGWSATDGGSVVSFPYSPSATTDITLYAKWSANTYVATFNSTGGSSVIDGVITTDVSLSAPTSPKRTGYTFLGWSKTLGSSSTVSWPRNNPPAQDLTFYAVWSADSHAVTFNSKGGSDVSAGSFATDGSLAEPTSPTRTGYTFLGWSATDGGSIVSFPYSPGVIVDVTLFARWSINSYVVTYNSKGGTSIYGGSFVYGGSIGSSPGVPYRSGAVFVGWSATDGGSAVSFPYSPGVASNVTLYAKWIVLAPVLSTSTPTTLVPGDVVTLRVSRVNEGCTVSVGWTDANTGVSSVSKIIKADRTTGVFTIATPAIAGSYTLSTNRISAECSGGLAVTLAKAFVIGKSSSVMAKVVTSNVYVAKNPVVSVSGTVKSGSVAVSNKAVTVSLRRNGVEVATASGTTNGSGVFNISLSSGSYVSGDYTAVVTVVADSVYRQAQVTTTKLTLR